MDVSAYHVISKEVENPSLDTIEFLDTHVCIDMVAGSLVSRAC